MRGSFRAALAVVVAFVTTTAVARAEGDVDTAASLFREGQRAYARGDSRAAALAFEEANRRAPHGAVILNAALAWDVAHEPARAADDFALAVAQGDLAAADRDRARARLAVLERTLGSIAVRGTAGTRVSVEHVGSALVPLVVHLSPGRHQVQAQFFDGSTSTRVAEVEAGGSTVLELRAPVAPPAAHSPTNAAAPVAKAERGVGALRTLGLGGLVLAALGAGAAIGTGSAALAARDDFDASGHVNAGDRSRASDLRTATNVSWAAAGILGAAGATLLVLSYTTRTKNAPLAAGELHLTPDGASAVFFF